MSAPVSFVEFFWLWSKEQRWQVPDIHVRICDFLEDYGDHGVLMVFRGAAKSTILAVYNAWRYHRDRAYRILHQGDQDGTAYKTSRDTRAVLRRHPLTKDWGQFIRGETQFWWVPGSNDERNPSMQAAGIMSNITSSRADEVQNDDVEVPKNIQTPEAREKLRYRLSEQTHILVPGGRTLFVGTPHTHDSLYEEQIGLGAKVLRIKLFEQEERFEDTSTATSYRLAFEPQYVFVGIHKFAKLLEPGKDYRYERGRLIFAAPPGVTIDCYAGCAWPERFTREEMQKRRRKCRTLNEWDSQYQLHAKPIGQIRLDPEKLRAYDLQPTMRPVNGEWCMELGRARIVGAVAYWDCSLGKIKSDASAFTLMLTDERGHLYWHLAEGLTGELAEFDRRGQVSAGQCFQVRQFVERFAIPRVVVETNGPGGFVPGILRRALKGTNCGVKEVWSTADKRKRILDGFEPPLSSRFLWAHVDVINGPVWDQMKDFNPAVLSQPDDYLDSGAGAISETPQRIVRPVGTSTGRAVEDWRPNSGVHEVQLEL